MRKSRINGSPGNIGVASFLINSISQIAYPKDDMRHNIQIVFHSICAVPSLDQFSD